MVVAFRLCQRSQRGSRVDNASWTRLIPGVHSARRLAAFLLVTLWLPALLHCRLEAAGLLFESECCSAGPCTPAPTTNQGCADDSCDVIEGEFTAPSALTLKAPAAEVGALLIGVFPIAPWTETSPPVVSEISLAAAAPPELARPWALIVPGPLAPRAP